MSDIITPWMDLTVPVPSTTLGPLFAQEVSDDLVTIDGHDHVTVGKPLTIAAININGDVVINSHNVTAVRSIRFQQQVSDLVGAQDLAALYSISPTGDLVFNDGSGDPIQITANHKLNVAALPGISNLVPFSISVASYPIVATSTFNLLQIHTAGNPVDVTLPPAPAAGAGRFYYFQDEDNSFATNNFTLTAPAGDNLFVNGVEGSSYVFGSNGQNGLIYTDGGVPGPTANWYVFTGAQLTYNSQTIYLVNSDLNLASNSTINNLGSATFSGLTSFNANASILATTLFIGDGTHFAELEITAASALTANANSSVNLAGTIGYAATSATTFTSGATATGTITIPTGNLTVAASGSGALNISAPINNSGFNTFSNTMQGTSTIPTGDTYTIAAAGSGAMSITAPTTATTLNILAGGTFTAPATTVSTFAGSLVSYGGLAGFNGTPFSLNSFNLTNVGGTVTLGTSLYEFPLIFCTGTLTSPLVINFGGCGFGSTFVVDVSQAVLGGNTISVKNTTSSPVQLPIATGKTSFIITCFSATTISVG